MASIDYFGIEEEIQRILLAALDETVVTVEEELNFPSEMTPWVGIYLDRRSRSSNQYLRAGTRVDFDLDFSIWCYCYRMELAEAVRKRDELITLVERTILGNPTFNGLVESSILNGGELATARLEGDSVGFAAGGSILLTAYNAVTLGA